MSLAGTKMVLLTENKNEPMGRLTMIFTLTWKNALTATLGTGAPVVAPRCTSFIAAAKSQYTGTAWSRALAE